MCLTLSKNRGALKKFEIKMENIKMENIFKCHFLDHTYFVSLAGRGVEKGHEGNRERQRERESECVFERRKQYFLKCNLN